MDSTLVPTPAPDRKHAVSLMRLRQAQCRFIISAADQKPMFCGEDDERRQLVRLAPIHCLPQ